MLHLNDAANERLLNILFQNYMLICLIDANIVVLSFIFHSYYSVLCGVLGGIPTR